MTSRAEFQWTRHADAEAYLTARLDDYLLRVPAADRLASDLLARAGSRLTDWLDHLVLADGDTPRRQLAEFGFMAEEMPAGPGNSVFYHPGTVFPRVILRTNTTSEPGEPIVAAIQVEDVSHFLMMHRRPVPIEGSMLGPYRSATAWQEDGHALLVVERRGHGGFIPAEMPPDYPRRYLRAYERWATRPRLFDDELVGMKQTLELARTLAADMGADTAAWIAFSAERAYWQGRSRAGQVQKARQDSLGLGWGNHDHHTFRSSREAFTLLIQILETLGFRARERFYAGAEAGWGAQVMEQPACRFAVFADVDLSPDEVEGDFAHTPLAARHELGTVGLWCALHGQSMLSAGMHHLASRFEFETITEELAEWGIQMMRPFSDFAYLRQAFTRGEQWAVAPDRVERLAASGQIDGLQRARFLEQGAIGSHLENIQRAEGFKGFNQQRVSDIIRRTDPRTGGGAA